jgi:SNF2 family DNA or RNA helicase
MSMVHTVNNWIPHDYQKDGINWTLSHKYCGLFLPPGLGKTSIMLQTISFCIMAKEIDAVIIVAPLRVCYMVWPNEIQKWDNFKHLSIGILHGLNKLKTLNKKHDIYIINPEGLNWLEDAIGAHKGKKLMLICDESTIFKNFGSQRFKIIKRLAPLFERRVILTGTPIPNGLIQIWSQIFILDLGKRLSKYITHFRQKYFYQTGYMGYEYKIIPGADKQIYDVIGDIILHKGTDELELPPLLQNEILVELPKYARTLYYDMKKDMMVEYGTDDEEVIYAESAASRDSKLKQIANGNVYDENKDTIIVHTEKINAIKAFVDDLNGQPVLIMYEFLHDLNSLKEAFPQAPIIGSGVVGNKLANICDKWNKGILPVLLLHPMVGGHGLNLQDGNCHNIVWLSIPFDLELHDQAIARVHRQGVKNSVTVHYVVAKGTIDEKIVKVLEGKADAQDAMLLAMKK